MRREYWQPEIFIESVDPVTGEVECRRLSLDEVIRRAAEIGACTVEDIKGRSRTASISAARRDYCQRARSAGFSWAEIGQFIGRDRTSCMTLVSGKKRAQ